MSEMFDVAIVGGGPGGAIVFRECLALGLRVCLLEKGARHPMDEDRAYGSQEMLLKYKNAGQTAIFGRPLIQYVEGRTLGGGSEINSGLYHRIPEGVRGQWIADFGLNLDEKDLLASYEDIERLLSVSLDAVVPDASARLQGFAARAGHAAVQVPRWYRGDVHKRQSMTQTVFADGGQAIVTGARAYRIMERSGFAEVLYRSLEDGRRSSVKARFVWVCGGSIDTPLLLERSKLGNRNVGRHMMCHPTLKLLVRFREELSPGGSPVGVHQVKFSDGIGFGCSIGSPPYLALHALDKGRETRARIQEAAGHCAIYYAMIRPETSGSVRSLLGAPLATCFLSRPDKAKLLLGLERLGEVFDSDEVSMRVPSVSGFDSMESLREASSRERQARMNVMTIHLFSSCRMSRCESLGAVDLDCRLYGSDRIFVGDSSILPSAPGVNPQGALMALVKLGFGRFKERHLL